MKKLLRKIDRFLLPEVPKFRYAPYVWLIYLFIFFTSLVTFADKPVDYLQAAIGTTLFLCFYFHAYWSDRLRVRIDILGILLVGSWMATISAGASVFFVYAGAFCCRLGSPRKAYIGIALVLVWVAVISVWYVNTPYFYVPAAVFTIIIGVVNIYEAEMDKKREALSLSQSETRALARTAERERIARDLHDLIGHTFSVITLKAELAGKLIHKDPERAETEINELAGISRDALQQVREVVTGYRASDLTTELAHAKYVLESNDIRFQYEYDIGELAEQVNKELAIILKELVTNILKHARAGKVSASVSQQQTQVVLEVADDGQGMPQELNSGFGLKGIRERVEKMSGHLEIENQAGAKFRICIPVEVTA